MRAAIAELDAGALVLIGGAYARSATTSRHPPATLRALADRGLAQFHAGPLGVDDAFRITPKGRELAAELARRAANREKIERGARMTWIQTRTGRAFDLLDPKAEDVDFAGDVAPALAHINRFTGHAGIYSVAQHSVLGARFLAETLGDRASAAEFLIHDCHEAYLGDIASPVAAAFVRHIAANAIVLAEMKKDIDRAIFAAAGLPLYARANVVKDIDARMLKTEREQLLGPPPRPWVIVIERAPALPIKIDRWSPARAVAEWSRAYNLYVNAIAPAAAPVNSTKGADK